MSNFPNSSFKICNEKNDEIPEPQPPVLLKHTELHELSKSEEQANLQSFENSEKKEEKNRPNAFEELDNILKKLVKRLSTSCPSSKDFSCLKPHKWMSDSILDAWMFLISPADSHVLMSTFWEPFVLPITKVMKRNNCSFGQVETHLTSSQKHLFEQVLHWSQAVREDDTSGISRIHEHLFLIPWIAKSRFRLFIVNPSLRHLEFYDNLVNYDDSGAQEMKESITTFFRDIFNIQLQIIDCITQKIQTSTECGPLICWFAALRMSNFEHNQIQNKVVLKYSTQMRTIIQQDLIELDMRRNTGKREENLKKLQQQHFSQEYLQLQSSQISSQKENNSNNQANW